jgi:hypothetical protein
MWSMLRIVAPVVADQHSCGLIGETAVWSGWQSDWVAAWIWRRGGRPMRERRPSMTQWRRGRRRQWEWSCVGGQCRWWSDRELRSVDGLTCRSGGWINRIGHLTRGTTPDGVEIDLLEGGADEGSERLWGLEPNRIPCMKNRLHIIIGCIALCLSTDIYIVQESWGARQL